MGRKDNDSIHNSVRPSEIDCDEEIENGEKNDCKENTAYYETAYDKSIRKMEECEESQKKKEPPMKTIAIVPMKLKGFVGW